MYGFQYLFYLRGKEADSSHPLVHSQDAHNTPDDNKSSTQSGLPHGSRESIFSPMLFFQDVLQLEVRIKGRPRTGTEAIWNGIWMLQPVS